MLNEVQDYDIIIGTSATDLRTKVKEALQQGWVPSGNIIKDDNLLLQAVVKFKK